MKQIVKKDLEWYRERRNWNSEWDSIVWSDEFRFLLFQNDAYYWVWHRPHEKYDINCLILIVKSGNQDVIIWECFVNDKLDLLIQVSGSITGSVYIEMLENDFLPFYNNLEGDLQYIF